MKSGGGERSGQAIWCERLAVNDEVRTTATGVDETRASRPTTAVQEGVPTNCWLGPADTSFSTGILRQQSSVLPGWLHSDALFWQHAIAAGPESSQKRAARGDPTMATDSANVATTFNITFDVSTNDRFTALKGDVSPDLTSGGTTASWSPLPRTVTTSSGQKTTGRVAAGGRPNEPAAGDGDGNGGTEDLRGHVSHYRGFNNDTNVTRTHRIPL